jgi:hypothetical protein
MVALQIASAIVYETALTLILLISKKSGAAPRREALIGTIDQCSPCSPSTGSCKSRRSPCLNRA